MKSEEKSKNDIDSISDNTIENIFREITSLNLSILIMNSMILALIDTLIKNDEKLLLSFNENMKKRSDELDEHFKAFTE